MVVVQAARKAEEEIVVAATWHTCEWHGGSGVQLQGPSGKSRQRNPNRMVTAVHDGVDKAQRRLCTATAERHDSDAVGGSGPRQIWGLGLGLGGFGHQFFFRVSNFCDRLATAIYGYKNQ